MLPNAFPIESNVLVETYFYDQNENPADPPEVQLEIRSPDGAVQDVLQGSMNNDFVGHWFYVVPIDQSGYWHAHWTGLGSFAAEDFITFYVRKPLG